MPFGYEIDAAGPRPGGPAMAPGTKMREPDRRLGHLPDGYLTQLCSSKKGSVGVVAVSLLLCCRHLLVGAVALRT